MSRDHNAMAGPSRSDADMPYDPDQDPEERRGIRRRYRDLKSEIEERQNNKDGAVEFFTQTVKQADDLFAKVKGTHEATLDSEVLVKASMHSALLARAMKSGGGAFDVDDFVSKLVIFMGGRHNVEEIGEGEDDDYDEEGDGTPLDWERIGWKAVAKTHRVPVMDFMLGPLSIEAKKRNVGKRSKLEKDKEERKKPQEIREEDVMRSENETTKNVSTLETILEEKGRMNLFRFIINPNDFGQSVENMFYLSFLIRDGKCALDFEDGEPNIFLCDPPNQDDYEQGLKKHQIIMELDMATWKRAIEVFQISESTIPQRPKAQQKIGKNWYG